MSVPISFPFSVKDFTEEIVKGLAEHQTPYLMIPVNYDAVQSFFCQQAV